MTGAPIPEGADAVVEVEATDAWDAQAGRSRPVTGPWVEIRKAVTPGYNVRRAGESVRAGEVVFAAGHRLRAPDIGLLISVGLQVVNVHSLPRVGILSTGSELVEPGQPLEPGQIRDSNRPALLLRLRELGYPAVDLGTSPDVEADLEARISNSLQDIDFLLTSGGVSVGDLDLTRTVLHRLGRVRSYRVAVKPGRPQLFGHVGRVPVFGLPGNPVSSLVVFDQFVLPALRKLAGRRDLLPPLFEAILQDPIGRRPGRVEFWRVRLEVEEGRWVARSTGPQGSGILSSLTRANGYAVLPADLERAEPGTVLRCQLMPRD
jgi:molybdopterin molybdotransferase